MQTVSRVPRIIGPAVAAFGAIVAIVAIALVAAPGASASKGQLSVIQDDGVLLSFDTATRAAALDEMQSLGVDVVKVGVFWRRFAPDFKSDTRPSFDATDPASYSWDPLDEVVAAILARGMRPWLMVTAPAPDWATAESTRSTQEGVYKPDPWHFAEFTEAVGRRFAAEVGIWSIYNEPNFQYWLWPQVGKGLVSHSAVHFRKIYVAAQKALVRSGNGADEILIGGLAPRASAPKPGQRSTQPLRFYRDFFCLDDRLKPLKGKAAKLRSCGGKYPKIIATGVAYHPYTLPGGPHIKPASPDDAPITHLKRVYRVLDRAAALKRLSKRKIPLWNAEFGYQSDPPDIFQTSMSQIPKYLNTGEYISYKDARVRSYAQYQLRDESIDEGESVGSYDRYRGYQSGLKFTNDTRKDNVYRSFQMPLIVLPSSSGAVKIWGGFRAAVPGMVVEIQARNGGGWTTVGSKTIKSPNGYFTQSLTVAGSARKSFRLKSGEVYSRETKPEKALKASSR